MLRESKTRTFYNLDSYYCRLLLHFWLLWLLPATFIFFLVRYHFMEYGNALWFFLESVAKNIKAEGLQ